MGKGLLEQKYEVYSEKYYVHGEILDYSFVIKLRFIYEDYKIEMAVERPFPDNSEVAFKKLGEETINTYIEKLLNGEIKTQRKMLHYWYIDRRQHTESGEDYLQAHGRVTGHKSLTDSIFIHTSVVKEVIINKDTEEAEIHTMNSIYYCPLSYCNFKRQDECSDIIPNYEEIKEAYKDSIKFPFIESGKVLLVLSNFDEYYFNSICFIPEGEKNPVEYQSYPHIGTFQDSFLVHSLDYKQFDIRWFPHYQNIEFYAERTNGHPLFVENIGDIVLYVKAECGVIKLEPGDRKEVSKENVEPDIHGLPGGDLYPAAMIGW